MPSDNKNNPPKPNTNKDQKVKDLPNKKGSGGKDESVKGGARRDGIGFEPVNG